MADVLYVGLQDDDKIVTFGIDAGAAKLIPRAETPAVGGPSVFALSPDRCFLYVGYRGSPAIESRRRVVIAQAPAFGSSEATRTGCRASRDTRSRLPRWPFDHHRSARTR